uniref:Reverse transcriptase Ty1/copia-type domain-containing protein n=1 Tax=Cannabis sativa TaxID=3483 RepID=A0A803NZS5_CANSA
MHLRAFGCTTYVHQSIDNLEPRYVKGTFLGYALGNKEYIIYISKKGRPKIVIARHVIFDELEYPYLRSEKGFTQVEEIDYTKIFSPVVKYNMIRLMLSLASQMEFEVEQLDVKTTFLNGFMSEEIYLKQPLGFQVEGKGVELICKLNKSLYDLK